MLRRGQTTTFPERLDITERAAAGQSNSEIAAALGCSVWTVRKWRRRGQHQGRTSLSSQMGRPPTGPLSTFPEDMRDAIVQMRRSHPGWGPTTLLAELQVDPRWTDQPLPSRSRIAALLSADHLTRRYQKHSELPIPAIQPEGAPHDELEAYQLMLRRAFLTCGLPRRISLDHGTVFYDNTSPSSFPTCLHLWLLADGASTCASRANAAPPTMPRLNARTKP
jgi:transposase-like protein